MMAKAEEDRLKQEVMRLEIRRTEMEMLKEAVRAGIQPHLIPQLFGSGAGSVQGGVYTPISPTNQGQAASARVPFPAPQQIPPFSKPGQPSPRYLPKLETANLPSNSQGHLATSATPAAHEQRHSISHTSSEQLQSAPALGNNEPEASSLFFHHWQPPSQSHIGGQQAALQQQQQTPLHQQQQSQQQHSASAEQVGPSRLQTATDPPTSPSPRKRKMQQYHILNSLGSPSAGSSRRSPSRGHIRHRSEASGLGHRFSEQYIPSMQSNNGYSARMSSDRESPKVQHNQTVVPSAQDLDAARKRKRSSHQEGDTADGSWGTAPDSIAEETDHHDGRKAS